MGNRAWTLLSVVVSMAVVGLTAARVGSPLQAGERMVADEVGNADAPAPRPSAASTSPGPRGPSRVPNEEATYLVVTPNGDDGGTKFLGTTGHTASFWLELVGEESDPSETFDLYCGVNLAMSCTSLSQSQITLWPNSPQGVTATFNAGSTAGTGEVSLTAAGWTPGQGGYGYYTYTIGAHPTVTSLSIPDSVIQNEDARTATFTVLNNDVAGTYTMTCDWGASPCSANPPAPYMTSGQDTVVTVTFDAGAIPTNFTMKLTATNGSLTDWDSESVTVTEFLSVNALALAAEVYAVPSTQRTDTFAVRFPAQASSSFVVTCSAGCTVNGSGNIADTVNVGDAVVKVATTHTAGGNGVTTTVTLAATKLGTSWITNVGSLSVIATSGILLSVDDANPGLELNRSDCLNVPAGAGAIVCDDFQYVYAFTPVMRMNQTRQLGLIYTSANIAAYGVVAANFVLPPGVSEPDSIRMTVVMNGDTVGTQSYTAAAYVPGAKSRIAMNWAWGAVPGLEQSPRFTVVVQPWSGGSPQAPATASGNLLSLALVETSTTAPRGWWIAGLEKLSVHGSDTLIWTGGDAGGAVYVKSGGTWIRRTRAVADTIVQSGGEYVRRLLGGGQVFFNSSGYQLRTVSPAGDTTRFNHTTIPSNGPYAAQRLTSIELPTPQSTDTVYKFTYESTYGTLATVQVRGQSSAWNTYSVHTSLATGSEVDSITAPDGTRVHFRGTWGQLDTIIGPRGDTTVISYGGYKVSQVRIKTADVDDVVIGYQPWSLNGQAASGWAGPRAIGEVSALFDGPLSGSADTTRFYTTGWGAVRGIRDAMGNETWIDRQDAAFPALPTRVRHANGWQVTTAYTAAGLPDTVIDRSTGAVATYTWSTTWRQPLTVRSPEGVVTTYTYDGNGNRTGEKIGSDSVRYTYNGDYLVSSVIDPVGRTTVLDYDAFGNVDSVMPPDSAWTRTLRDYRGMDTLTIAPIAASHSITVRSLRDVMGRDTLVRTTNSQDNLGTFVRTTYEFGQVKRVEPYSVAESGDTTTVGATEWTYDDLGRPVAIATPVSTEYLTYDSAGRVIRSVNADDTVKVTYDVLGRVLSRWRSASVYNDGDIGPYNNWTFPAYGDLTFDSASDVFTYDSMGRMRSARNNFARTTRTYRLDGSLATEVDSLNNAALTSFNSLVYQRSYLYDRDGRRVHLMHPTWINSGSDRTDYAYDAVSGRLSSITDPLGNLYAFTYFKDGQPRKMTFPAAVDSFTYDAGGRLDTHRMHAGGNTVVSETLDYDDAGRVILDEVEYNGLGHVSDYMNGYEVFTRDGFGNVLAKDVGAVDPTTYVSTLDADNALRVQSTRAEWNAPCGYATDEPDGWVGDLSDHDYDTRGNLIASGYYSYGWDFSGPECEPTGATAETESRSLAKSYYAADGQLRVHQIISDQVIHTTNPVSFTTRVGSYDEYRYDALGRRVMKITNQGSEVCGIPANCYSAVERYVWDGDQILWEFRLAYGDTALDPSPSPSNGQTGHVGYVHAGGVDAPIGMIRNDTSVVLRRLHHRRLYSGANLTSGASLGGTTGWPTSSMGTLTGLAPYAVNTWVGSLPVDQQDASGLKYRRNRYYDPASDQFTQADPIGFGGGFSLYGYAGGDPINRGDPYGLCPYPGQEEVTCYVLPEVTGTYNRMYGSWLFSFGRIGPSTGGGAMRDDELDLASSNWGTGGGASTAGPTTPPLVGVPPLVIPGSALGKLLGHRFPVKIGAGGRTQPFDPATGRYLSPIVNGGVSTSLAAQFGLGYVEGIVGSSTLTSVGPALTRAQAIGQFIGKVHGWWIRP